MEEVKNNVMDDEMVGNEIRYIEIPMFDIRLELLLYKGTPVLTTKMISKLHGISTKSINRFYNRNHDKFEQFHDYEYISGNELSELKRLNPWISESVSTLMVWYDSGFERISRCLSNEDRNLYGDLYDVIVDEYFHVDGFERNIERVYMNIKGSELRKEREELGISLAQLSHTLGCSRGRLTRFERGENVTDAKLIRNAYDMALKLHKMKTLENENKEDVFNVATPKETCANNVLVRLIDVIDDIAVAATIKNSAGRSFLHDNHVFENLESLKAQVTEFVLCNSGCLR